jgi:hypothetical protein
MKKCAERVDNFLVFALQRSASLRAIMLYVDYCSEEDQVLELARFLGKLREKSGSAEAAAQLIQQCEALVKDNKYLEVLTKILDESQELFASGADKGSQFSGSLFWTASGTLWGNKFAVDVESVLCLFASLVVKLGKDKLLQIKDQLFAAIAGGQDKPIVRLSVYVQHAAAESTVVHVSKIRQPNSDDARTCWEAFVIPTA